VRVLYVLGNYPQLSESYIQAEIEFAIRSGVDVHVWSAACRHPFIQPPCPVYRGNLSEALISAKPDLLHVHYLHEWRGRASTLPRDLPATVRGHSFDWNPETCTWVLKDSRVKKVYLFPHFAETVKDPKVVPLPVAFSSMRFQGSSEKDRRMVFRTGAGLPTKGLRDFFLAATLCPDHRFVLAVAVAGGYEKFLEDLHAMNVESGMRVEIMIDVSWEEVARLTAKAGIYMDTSDPAGHSFGMPISIAESMATGSYVLAREAPGISGYLGEVGDIYTTYEQAAELVRETLSWDDQDWEATSIAAQKRSALFTDHAVLPRLLQDWKVVAGRP